MKVRFLLCFALFSLFADSELHSDVEGALQFNERLEELKKDLQKHFKKGAALHESGADLAEYQMLLGEVAKKRGEIQALEEQWRQVAVNEGTKLDEPYALWDVGETSISQLIMEYGASDFLYVIPQELNNMKITLFSNIPLPHESWSEMIELILMQNGVGVKKLNAFVKQLYILKLDPAFVEAVVAKESDLALFSPSTRLFYVFSPPPEHLKSVQSFFERFSDPKQALIQAIGSKIAIVSSKHTIEKLLGLYQAVWEQSQGKVVRIVPLNKMTPTEAEKILKTIFQEGGVKARATYHPSSVDELSTFVLPQGLALIGGAATVERAENILNEMLAQLEDPAEKVIYWYTCKHSDPEDIAAVLQQVYSSLNRSFMEGQEKPLAENKNSLFPPIKEQKKTNDKNCPPLPSFCPGPGFNPVMPATAPFVQPGTYSEEGKTDFGNFIVDQKTTSILMVLSREELSKIKDLLKRLDVPKRMVQLDVLLVEKKFKDNREVGFSLLQLGTNSSGNKETAVSYATTNEKGSFSNGLLSFIFSRPSGSFPAADMKFNFLLAQEDVRIKANPSILAINQTPAQISIVEEISINNGAFPFNSPTGTIIQDSYTRAQYGITINLTPTIHVSESDSSVGFVSLDTDLEFDTTKMISQNNRPPVTRRNIKNQVRVADGETIILGGLRQQIEEDSREKIPFLGDLPGIGKLFGTSRSRDVSTEMFIFITPKIIRDPVEDLLLIRQEEYEKRPGDLPEFLDRIDEAKQQARKKLFKQSIELLFDKNN